MAIEVFNRHEKKYIVDEKSFSRLQKRLTDYMKPDPNSKNGQFYTVKSLYCDTPDSHLIRTSLAKPIYKEKLRIRGYGELDMNSLVYIEIKKKLAGTVNKRRSALRLSEAYTFLNTGEPGTLAPYMNLQVLSEISYMISREELFPALYLAYDRVAYFAEERSNLRISFDTNIRSRRTELRLEAGDFGRKLLEDGLWLMEIKTENSLPLWLVHLLSEFSLYPKSFSKYGTEYNTHLSHQTLDETPVINRVQHSNIPA